MPSPRIVIIEDEPELRRVLQYNLEREGFAVLCAADGEQGLRLVSEELPDLVLLDLLLPGVDGIEICRRLKLDPATREIPIIMVTAKGEEPDIVLGLGVGADDYATKPFRPRELIARIRAVMRRGRIEQREPVSGTLERAGLQVDLQRHEVRLEGAVVPFTATEFRLLHCLASRPGRVFTRELLIRRAIGDRATVVDRTIDVHIQSIRKKLGPQRDLIETIRGVGYRFREQERTLPT